MFAGHFTISHLLSHLATKGQFPGLQFSPGTALQVVPCAHVVYAHGLTPWKKKESVI